MTKAKAIQRQRSEYHFHIESLDTPERELTPEEEEALVEEWLSDPDYEAYVREKIQEALDDPRPPISAEEVRRRLDEKFAVDRKRYQQ